MNCKEIIIAWLKEHDYDGLTWPEECGCGFDDFAPCGIVNLCCEPGYRGWYTDKPEKKERREIK